MTAPVPTGNVALALPTLSLSQSERKLCEDLIARLNRYRPENNSKREYYEAKKRREDLRIAIPPSLEGMEVAVGWPAAAVDCVEERLDFEAWLPGTDTDKEDPFGLEEVYLSNDLDVEAVKVHLDALTYGVAFAMVTTGADGEPDPLITVESPLHMTADIDPRTRRIRSAYAQNVDLDNAIVSATLMLPDETILLESSAAPDGQPDPASWKITNRDKHKLGRVAVAQFVNRPRSGGTAGHSEITETVRRLTQSGLRTLAAAEIAREYYAAPQRYVLGAKESFFQNPDGTPIPAWKSYMGRLLALERDEYGDLPNVQEFRGQSLETFFGMMKVLTQILSGEAGIPQNYLGFSTDNPPSADAIGAMEHRLVKRAERRQKEFGRGWTEVARLSIMVRDGKAELAKEILKVRPKWRPAHTPTLAAQADATTKMVGAGIMPTQGRVTWDSVGISREDQKAMEIDFRKASTMGMLAGMRGTGAGTNPQPTTPGQQPQPGKVVPLKPTATGGNSGNAG